MNTVVRALRHSHINEKPSMLTDLLLLIYCILAGTLLVAPITCCDAMLDGLQVIHLQLQ